MTSEASSTTARKPRRRWRQFSLRALLVVMVVCGAAWLLAEYRKARRPPPISSVLPKTATRVKDVPGVLESAFAHADTLTFLSYDGEWQGLDNDVELVLRADGSASLVGYHMSVVVSHGTYALTVAPDGEPAEVAIVLNDVSWPPMEVYEDKEDLLLIPSADPDARLRGLLTWPLRQRVHENNFWAEIESQAEPTPAAPGAHHFTDGSPIWTNTSAQELLAELPNLAGYDIDFCNYTVHHERVGNGLPAPSDMKWWIVGWLKFSEDSSRSLRADFAWVPLDRAAIPENLAPLLPDGELLVSPEFNETFSQNQTYAHGFAVLSAREGSRIVYFLANDIDHALDSSNEQQPAAQ